MNYELIKPINPEYTVIQQILTNRGIALEDIDHYLNVSNSDNLSPLFLNNIENAAKILINHIDRGGQILVIVDSDCDGFTSAALLINYLYTRFPSFVDKIKYVLHETKIHGIELDKVSEDVSLVVVPDASSNEYEKHKQLAEKGIDIIVLDHHIAERESEYACVVNNQLCDYPTKSLSGVGIVYKLCQYLDSLFGDNMADDYLDIVALGLSGDMMDQRDFETHYLTQQGLQNIRNPFIKGMVDKNKRQIGNEPSSMGLAFYVVPFVNAVTRVGTMEEKTLLFESMLECKAFNLIPSTKRGCKGQQETRIEQSLRTCVNVKSRQTKNQDKAVEQIESIITKDNLLSHKILLIQLQELDFNRAIVGLIANKIMAKYQRPTCILIKSVQEDEKVVWSGSARACGIDDFRSFCENSGLCEYAQGHPSAYGLCIEDSNVSGFIDLCDKEFIDKDFSTKYRVDFIYSSSNVNSKDILDIASLKPLVGQNIWEPLIVVEDIKVTKDMLQLMSRDKNPTLKITLSNGISLIKFKSSEEEFNKLYSDSGCAVINILGKCERNNYMNRISPQIIVENYEIITKQKYYF